MGNSFRSHGEAEGPSYEELREGLRTASAELARLGALLRRLEEPGSAAASAGDLGACPAAAAPGAGGADGEGVTESAWPVYGVLAAWVVLLTCMHRWCLLESRRYKRTCAHTNVAIGGYMRYRLGHWYAWTSGAATFVLGAFSLTLLTVGGLLHSFTTGVSLSESFWAAWIWVVAPDGGSSASPGGYLVGMLTSTGGMLIFALLVSLVTSSFAEALETLRQGSSWVVEGNHTVILGWKPMTCDIISELCMAMEPRGGGTIVVLSPFPKTTIEEQLKDRQVNLRNSSLEIRSGEPHAKADLLKVAVSEARVVLVLAGDDVSEEDADSRTLRVLLTLYSQGWPVAADARLVVECCLVRNQDLFHSLAARKMQVLSVQDFMGELIVESSRQHGISRILAMILGFEGDEFYLANVKDLEGWTFQDLLFAFPDVIPVGFACRNRERVELLPPMDYTFDGSESLLVLAEDESCLPQRVPPPRSEAAQVLRSRRAASKESRKGCRAKLVEPQRAKESIVILGWNHAIGALMVELDRIVAPGSEVLIYSPCPASDRKQYLQAAQTRRGYRFSNMTVLHEEGKLGARYRLEFLPLESASRIFILAEGSAPSAWEADGQTIAMILQVRDILALRLGELDSDRLTIIPQILERSSEEGILACGLPDCIDASVLSARVLASICETPWMGWVLQEMLSDDGPRFCLRRLQELLQLPPEATEQERKAAVPKQVTFDQVSTMAAASGQVAIGWSVSDPQSWELNPKQKGLVRNWDAEEDLLVCLTPPRRPEPGAADPLPMELQPSQRIKSFSARRQSTAPALMQAELPVRGDSGRRLGWTRRGSASSIDSDSSPSADAADSPMVKTPSQRRRLSSSTTCQF